MPCLELEEAREEQPARNPIDEQFEHELGHERAVCVCVGVGVGVGVWDDELGNERVHHLIDTTGSGFGICIDPVTCVVLRKGNTLPIGHDVLGRVAGVRVCVWRWWGGGPPPPPGAEPPPPGCVCVHACVCVCGPHLGRVATSVAGVRCPLGWKLNKALRAGVCVCACVCVAVGGGGRLPGE